MGDLRKNISRHELECHCGCGLDTMDGETLDVVQDVCDHFAFELEVDRVVLDITSAARCFDYNRRPVSKGGAGSNDQSQHPRCRAMDFRIKGVALKKIHAYLIDKYKGKYGIGLYKTFIHIDTRTLGPARWKG